MTSPIKSFRDILIADAALVALLGGQKVFHYEVPQATERPVIVLYEAGGQPLGETLTRTIDPLVRRISIDCQAMTPTAADEIADRATALLNNLSGEASGLRFQYCRVVSDIAKYEESLRVPQRIVDFRVVFTRI